METIKIRRLTPKDSPLISKFLYENNFLHFSPHSYIEEEIFDILETMIRDLYYGLFLDEQLIGYGLLRGMDEGYETPSLGIAIDYYFQGLGYGRQLMDFLEAKSGLAGYKQLRLRVHRDNEVAINLYTSLGYKLEDYDENYWLGIKEV